MIRVLMTGLVLLAVFVAPLKAQTQTTSMLTIVNVEPLGTDEVITLQHHGDGKDFGGWTLTAGRQQPLPYLFRFPERCYVPTDAVIRIHSGPSQLNQQHSTCGLAEIDLVWQAGFVLSNDMGVVEMRNADGVVQDVFTYPKPYHAEEVQFSNQDITLSGTLTIPNKKGPHPAVIMISGSGAQDRDQTVFGFAIFRLIADALSRRGIAVLRYDDRGVGGSTGNVFEATISDRAADVVSAIELLKNHVDIDPNRIGLLGHSEGGMVAPIASVQSNDVAFIVMLASLGIEGDELLLAQTERLLRLNGAPTRLITAQLNILNIIFEAIALDTDADWLRVEAALAQLGMSQSAIDQQLEVAQSAWYRSFVNFDPVPHLSQLTVPVLAIFGGLDIQAPADLNMAGMQQAFSLSNHHGVTYHTFPRANHLFQPAISGNISEYEVLPKSFVPGFLQTLTDWVVSLTID